jgi:hypothetical protein
MATPISTNKMITATPPNTATVMMWPVVHHDLEGGGGGGGGGGEGVVGIRPVTAHDMARALTGCATTLVNDSSQTPAWAIRTCIMSV